MKFSAAKKTIGVDLRMWDHPGIGRYIRELTGAMIALAGAERFLFLAYARDEADIRGRLGKVALVPARSAIYSFSEQAELSAFSKKVSLLHVPHFNAPLFCRSKLVVTIHDLIYLNPSLQRIVGNGRDRSLRWLGGLYAQTMMRGIERNASAVIAVSDYTRRDLEKAFPKTAGRTHVVHEAASSSFGDRGDEAEAKKKFGLEEYLLFVGSLKAHKNLPALLEAFGRLRDAQKTSAQLVVVGKKDPKEEALFNRVSGTPSVRYLGERSDEELAQLYRGARALVIPSLWEGFGLTAIEAMASGTPVISSDRASLPEVVGDAGLLFDPEDTDRLTAILEEVLTDAGLRSSLSKKGLERAKRFSWQAAARQTLAIYEKVLS